MWERLIVEAQNLGNPSYPLDRMLGGPQSLSESGSEEKNSQPPPEIEP
jgi:hypothetical protein